MSDKIHGTCLISVLGFGENYLPQSYYDISFEPSSDTVGRVVSEFINWTSKPQIIGTQNIDVKPLLDMHWKKCTLFRLTISDKDASVQGSLHNVPISIDPACYKTNTATQCQYLLVFSRYISSYQHHIQVHIQVSTVSNQANRLFQFQTYWTPN